jgi:hypothetical protein
LKPPTSKIVISEIMYHPVKETTAEDEHEFVELHNSGDEPASVAGWRLRVGKSDRLTLPEGTSIAAKGYLVLAKRRDRLLALPSYALSPEVVVGDYLGGLDNGGSTVSILDDQGTIQDSVAYEDDAPWPIGADAFGAQEEWLPELGRYETHQYLGRSLERYSPTLPSSDPRNWEASPVDGATPGRANHVAGEPPVIVLGATALSESSQSKIIGASDAVRVTAVLSDGSASDLAVEYRLDPVERVGTTTNSVPMKAKPSAPSTYEAILPPAAANTVVRYRIVGSRDGSTVSRIGPRETDPTEFYAYFVGPPPASGPSYHLFITPQRWTTLWTNIAGGLNTRCTVNNAWDATVPAVFVSGRQVYDVHVRYQGSRYRRTDGVELPRWTAPGPTQPNPMRALSWRVKFPRYNKFDGLDATNLNKLKQACPGVLNALEGALMQAAGIPAQKFSFARLYINGGYYNYVMDARNIEESDLEEFEGPQGSVGDLFKADGVASDETGRTAGPWGRGDFTPLVPACDLTAQERYQLTYERQTHDWKGLTEGGHQTLIGLIEQLTPIAATSDADARVRDYLTQNFDVPRLITQFAIRNWAGVWDDGVHNYLPYQRSTDGKWVVLPHDFDCDFGGDPVDCGDFGQFYNAPTLSFYHPESGDGITAGGAMLLKVQLIRAFRTEFAERIRELGNTLFTEQSIDALLSEVMAGFDRKAWEEAPARSCDLDARVDSAKRWLAERRSFLAEGVR